MPCQRRHGRGGFMAPFNLTAPRSYYGVRARAAGDVLIYYLADITRVPFTLARTHLGSAEN